MTVRELITRLSQLDPEAEVHKCDDNAWGGSSEINEVYESTATYGLLLPTPTTVKTVVLATGSEGL
jgi:hypothetical protein